MKKILLAAFAFLAALSAVTASDMIYSRIRQKKDLLLRQDAPAEDWESQYFPIGNGSLGAMLNGGIVEKERTRHTMFLRSGKISVISFHTRLVTCICVTLCGTSVAVRTTFRDTEESKTVTG